MRHFLIGLLSFMLIGQSSVECRAEKALTLGVFDFFPWGYDSKDYVKTGITVDLTEALSELSGLTITPKFRPVVRAFREVEKGETDLVFAYRLEEMVPGVTFLGDIGCLTANIVTRKGAGITTMADLNGKRIAFVIGGYFHAEYQDKLGVTEVMADSNQQMMALLMARRIDGFVINNAIVDAFLKIGPPFEEMLPKDWKERLGHILNLEQLPVAIGISNRVMTSETVKILRDAIKRGQIEGRFDAIYRKWGAKEGWVCH